MHTNGQTGPLEAVTGPPPFRKGVVAGIFKAGAANADGQAIDEILHYITVNDTGDGVSEQKITRFASDRIPMHSILRVIEIMERSGVIRLNRTSKQPRIRFFSRNG